MRYCRLPKAGGSVWSVCSSVVQRVRVRVRAQRGAGGVRAGGPRGGAPAALRAAGASAARAAPVCAPPPLQDYYY